MDSKKELEAKLQKMKADIKEASDSELDMMGMETQLMVVLLTKMHGPDDENVVAANALLEIFRSEFLRRQGGKTEAETKTEAEPAVAIVVQETPKTFNQLMSLGDASVEEPEMVNKI